MRKAIGRHGAPEKITIDKSGANAAAIESYNQEHEADIEIRQVKYLTDIFDKRFSSSRANFHVARATAWRRAGMGCEPAACLYDERFPFAAPVHPAGLVCQLATKRA